MRRLALVPLLVVALTACSVPEPETLDCGADQSVFACKAKFSDGKSRSIVFVKVALPDQPVLDVVSTRDDLGNPYCVTLYGNATATFVGGECGSPTAVTQDPTATTVDPNAVPQGVACTEGTSVYDCRATYSDGTLRGVQFVDVVSEEAEKVDRDPHTDDQGNVLCVTVFSDGSATFREGATDC